MKNLKILFLLLAGVMGSCLNTDEGLSFEEQLEKDLATIDQYLTDNGIDAEQDPDGFIRYVIHVEGSGASPTLEHCVAVNYLGKLLTGATFDDGEDAKFPLGGPYGVIAGWQIGLPLMQVGDSATLYIPSGLAYGTQGVPGLVPGNSNLIFRVGLHGVTTYNASTGSCD
jgi:FKBP-type peptidyl-prolyl cis-trans isomerase